MRKGIDPMVRAANKAYKESAVGKLAALLVVERRWKSKETMARNKLREVREQISEFAVALAKEKTGVNDE